MKKLAPTLFLVLFTFTMYAQVAQYRGANRDGHYNETGFLKSWPEEGPELLFSVHDIGSGYSTPVEEDDVIYVTGKKDSLDYLTAIDLNGDVKYNVPFAPSWPQSFAGSRSIPAIIDGKGIWSVDVFGTFGGKCGSWGIAESPLVVDNKVIYTPAGSQTTMVALVKPAPKDFEIISSLRITEGGGPCWANPSISGGKLQVRHRDVLIVYNIAKSG